MPNKMVNIIQSRGRLPKMYSNIKNINEVVKMNFPKLMNAIYICYILFVSECLS